MAKISVIVPVYNVENYLERCINSILNQTFADIEIILVDDGSMDRSSIICDELSQKDRRIKTFHKHNGGLSDARNFGLCQASCNLITFVDSDDWLEKDALSYLYVLIKKYDADFVMAENRRPSNKLKNEKEFKIQEESLNREEFLKKFFKIRTQENVQYAWGKLYKSSLFKNIKYPKGLTNEDVLTTFEIAINSSKIVYSNKIIYNYFVNNESITTQKFSDKRLDLLKIWDLVIESAQRNNCNFWTIKNAKLNRYRANFGILTNLATANIPLHEKREFLKKHSDIYKDFKNEYGSLVTARIPFSRKFLMTSYYISYDFSLVLLHLISRIVKEY